MTAATMAFGIATLICYLPMTRLQNRRATNGSSRDGFGWVGSADIGDGASHFVWSGDDNLAAGHSGAANEVMAREVRRRRRTRLTIRRSDLPSELLRPPPAF